MFNLEQSITEWRRQMLAAGIPSPVPMEELESHLREEIELQVKSEISEMEAFRIAVLKIGQQKILRSEFKKLESGYKAKLALKPIAWLAAGMVLLAGWIRFALDWSLISFHPNFNFYTIEDVGIIAFAETAIWFLAKANRDLPSRVISLAVCIILAVLAALSYHDASQPQRGIFGGIREPDPLWFRLGLSGLLLLPGGSWFWWLWRRKAQRWRISHDHQEICSS